MDGLVEFMLRIFQSLVIDPGHPPHQGKELRGFLRRWVAPAISGLVPVHTPAPATTKTKPTRRASQTKTGGAALTVVGSARPGTRGPSAPRSPSPPTS
jgi:hypothetical protein